MDIIQHSLSLKYAVVERKGKIYAMDRGSVMNSDLPVSHRKIIDREF
jgi:hypothetical protein